VILLLTGFVPLLGLPAIHAVWSWRRQRAMLLLASVEQAVRLNLPIGPVVVAADDADGMRGGPKARRLRSMLENGMNLGAALLLAAPAIGRRRASLIQAAERAGLVASTLSRLMAQDRRSDALRDHGSWLYPLLMMWAVMAGVLAISAWMGTWIMPHLQSMAAEVNSGYGRHVDDLSRVVPWLMPAAVAVFIAGHAALVWACLAVLTPAWSLPSRLAWLADRLYYHVPILGTMARNRALAEVCALLADGAAAGQPLPTLLRECEAMWINRLLGRRLRAMALRIEQGVDAAAAARAARLPGLIGSALGAADAPAALRFLAGHYDAVHRRAGELLASTIGPVITLAMGAGVGLFITAVYLPMMNVYSSVAHIAEGTP
jgi:type II secretory pathway component PulF